LDRVAAMTLSPQRLAEWRAQPLRAAIRAWENRTYGAARTGLARRYPGEMLAFRDDGYTREQARTRLTRNHPAEFLSVLDRIREQDPKPEGLEDRDAA
jgi:hypothetical protein